MNEYLYKILASSFGLPNMESNYDSMLKQLNEQVKREIKSKELTDKEIEELCGSIGIDCCDKTKSFAKKLETTFKTKYGIPTNLQ